VANGASPFKRDYITFEPLAPTSATLERTALGLTRRSSADAQLDDSYPLSRSAPWTETTSKGQVDAMEQEIIVRGYGEARSMPDRAIVHVTIQRESPSRDTAYTRAARACGEVDHVVESRRDALTKVTVASLVVRPTTRWENGEYVPTGWAAARASILDVVGFDQLGELIAELAAAGATVAGPRWELDPGNAAHSAARRSASLDARRRADDYAGALGLEVEEVSWISEPGLRLPGSIDASTRAISATAAPMRSSAPDEEIIEAAPAEITSTATVDVAFRIRAG
jgi:uncharacterized protein YggE